MNKATKLVLGLALIAAVLLLAGCNLSASKAPALEPSATSEMLFMTETPGQGLAGDIATQTAQAGQPAVATETPIPAEGGEPQPEATQAPTDGQQPADATQAPAQPQQPVVIPTLERPSSYTLQPGEFPFCIARRFDLNVADLLAANGLSMESKPSAGTTLDIPSGGSFAGDRALRAHGNYQVNAGDTIYEIACYFGDVSPEAIIAVNGLAGPDDIKAGMTLKIP
jgi:LysM repeat protein